MKNRIYFFTGTGNSLQAAQLIAAALPDCELKAIYKGAPWEIPAGLERIGFVFPAYSGGPPRMLADFIRDVQLPEQGDSYLFAVATYGGNKGNVIPEMAARFAERNWRLHYGAALWAYPNAVVFYPMLKGAKLIAKVSAHKAQRLAEKIAAKEQLPIPALDKAAGQKYKDFMANIHDSDKDFYANEDCISCGICVQVCPAENIVLEEGRPVFQHHCECCMACIQHCPKRALNDRGRTEKRGRYVHPGVKHSRISAYYQGGKS